VSQKPLNLLQEPDSTITPKLRKSYTFFAFVFPPLFFNLIKLNCSVITFPVSPPSLFKVVSKPNHRELIFTLWLILYFFHYLKLEQVSALQYDQLFWRFCDNFTTFFLNNYRIFYAHPSPIRYIYSWLNRYNISYLKYHFTSSSNIRFLMYF